MSNFSPLKANRFFTNRENHFISFKNALSNLKEKQFCVLSFYGVGGIGKTRLKEELIKTVENDGNIIVSSSLNFQQSEFRNFSTAIFLLYKDLKSKKISFPTFEIAHAIYYQKIHPEQPISKSGLSYIENGSIVFDIISIAKDIPIIGLIPKIGSLLYKANSKFNDWWIKYGERELATIQNLEPHQIEEALPYYFSLDLADYLNSNSKDVVFFIDTYESLWEKEDDRKKEKFFSKDRWIRNLIKSLPQHTLWVVLGREKLRWDEIDENINWSDFLNQHLLGELSFNDANSFLERCNVVDEYVRNQMIKSSKGLPFYLDLQVDAYNEILKSGNIPTVDKFGRNYYEILERFCKYLSANETETLKILSCAKFWDYTIFKKIINEFKTGFPLTAFSDLLKFSFINEASVEGEKVFSIHQIMRTHLKENIDANLRVEIHSLIFKHYEELLDIHAIEYLELNSKVIFLLEEAIYHKGKMGKSVNFYKWLLETSQKLYGSINSTAVQDALKEGKKDLDFNSNYLIIIRISYEIARLYGWKDDEVDSQSFFIEEGLNQVEMIIQEKYNSNVDDLKFNEPELIRLKTDLLILKAEFKQNIDKNIEAYSLFLEATKIGKIIDYSPDLQSFSRLLIDLGRIPEAEGFFYNELRNAIRTSDIEYQALCYSNIGKLSVAQRMNNYAIACFEKSLELYELKKGKEHRYCWIVKHRYAFALMQCGDVQKAQGLLYEILKWYETQYGDSHYELGYIYLSLAKCEKYLNSYSECIGHCLKTIELLYPKYGLSNAEVIEAQLVFCEIIQRINASKTLNCDEIDEESLIGFDNLYNNLIIQFEHQIFNNFRILLKNYGYNSRLLDTYYLVISKYYEIKEDFEKKTILNKRMKEVERVFKEQFRIRELEQNDKEKIEGKDKELFLNRINKDWGVFTNLPLEIFKSKLPFFKETYVYYLVYSENSVRYIFEYLDNLSMLDYTNKPIYDIVDKDLFVLSLDSVFNYLLFFFDAVKGKHGKFYFPKNELDIPFREDIEIKEETIKTIQSNLQIPKVLECSTDNIIIECNCFFKDCLYKSDVQIKSNGMVSINNEELVLEDLPIAVEPQFANEELSNEDLIQEILMFLEYRLKQFPIETVDEKLHNNLMSKISFVKDNYSAIDIQEDIIYEIFDDGIFLMDKYIKPTYDNELIYQEEIAATLSVIKQILEQSDFKKKRSSIQLNIRVLKGESTELATEEKESIIDHLLNSSIISNKPQDIFMKYLSFYPNTIVYMLQMDNDKIKYVLKNSELSLLLDCTNRPIYTISNNDFILSPITVADYVYFFFDSVIGKNGRFYIPKAKDDIPYINELAISKEVHDEIIELNNPLEIISVHDDAIILKGVIFFKDSLFNSMIKVDSKGMCELYDEELILENLPVNSNVNN
jgi:hypothetical protein